MDSKRYSPLEIRQIFYQNLLLLGFQPGQMEIKYKTPFNKDMFSLPNKKAMEVVLHFLFENYDQAMTEVAFRDSWPVIDKQREQQFRKTSVRLLSEIAEKEPNSNLPRIMASALLNPTGDRFYSFLNRFSIVVMRKVMATKFGKSHGLPQLPKINPEKAALANSMKLILLAQQIRYKNKFCELSSEMAEIQNTWKEFALTLTKNYRKTNKNIREIEKEINAINSIIKDKKGKSSSPFRENRKYDQDTTALLRTESLHNVRDLWARVNNFYSSLQSQRDVVNSAVEGKLRQQQLDGNDIPLKIPDMLLRKYKKDIRSSDTGNTLEGGKVNLLSLVYLWNLSLHFLKEDLSQEKLPDLEKLSKIAADLNHKHHQILRNAKELRSVLTSGVIPEVKTSINMASTRITNNKTDVNRTRENFITPKKSNITLGLIPPSPAVSFSNSQAKPLAKIHAAKDQDSTPFVVRNLSHLMKVDSNVRTKKDKTVKGTDAIMKESIYLKDDHVRNSSKVSKSTSLHSNNSKTRIAKLKKKSNDSQNIRPTSNNHIRVTSRIASDVVNDRHDVAAQLESSSDLNLKTATIDKENHGNDRGTAENQNIADNVYLFSNDASNLISPLTPSETVIADENADSPMQKFNDWSNLNYQLGNVDANTETANDSITNADYLDNQITPLSNNSSEDHDNDNGNRKLNMTGIDTEVSKAIQAALHDLDIYSSSDSSDQLSKIKDNYLAEENSESELEYNGENFDTDNFVPVEAETNKKYNIEFNEIHQQMESSIRQSGNLDSPIVQDFNKLISDSDIAHENSDTSLTKERYSSKNIISLDVNILKSDISSGSECGSPGLPELIEIPAVSARKSTAPFGDRLKDSIKSDSSFPKFDLNVDDAEINEEEDDWLQMI